MKDFITSIASVLLLMIFLLQFVTNQITYTRIASAERAVKDFQHLSEAQEEVRAEDGRQLQQRISQLVGCSPDQVQLHLSGADDAGGRSQSYRVSVPIAGVIGAARMLGLSEAQNTICHQMSGTIYIPEAEPEPPAEGETPETEDFPQNGGYDEEPDTDIGADGADDPAP